MSPTQVLTDTRELSSLRTQLDIAVEAREHAERATRELQAMAERLSRQLATTKAEHEERVAELARMLQEAVTDRLVMSRALLAETAKSEELEKRLAVLSGRAGSLGA